MATLVLTDEGDGRVGQVDDFDAVAEVDQELVKLLRQRMNLTVGMDLSDENELGRMRLRLMERFELLGSLGGLVGGAIHDLCADEAAKLRKPPLVEYPAETP